jgi:voltage-gated potassium channel
VGLVLAGTHYLVVIRILRVLRIFRVLKLGECVSEANVLKRALIASRKKIFVFIFTVLTMVVIIGSVIYLIEGVENGFTSIPKSVYWAIVTLTTVGYGDLSPQTPFGQLLASMVMILGYSIIAVPTSIMTVELAQAVKDKKITSKTCPECSKQGHDPDADHCKYCGAEL